jgi:hypothetical protein
VIPGTANVRVSLFFSSAIADRLEASGWPCPQYVRRMQPHDAKGGETFLQLKATQSLLSSVLRR